MTCNIYTDLTTDFLNL